MRILLLSHGFPPESIGGVEQHVDGLARALVAAGHAVEVYAKSHRPGPQFTTVADDRGPCPVTRVVYRYEGLDSLAAMYRVPQLDETLRGFLASRRFDVAHVHHLTGMSTGAIDVLRQSGIPVAMTLHDYWTMCPRGQMWHRDGTACARVEPARCAACLAPTFGGWLPDDRRDAIVGELHDAARATLGAADALVVPSARAIPPFVELGIPAERIRVVENGVDTDALRGLPAPDFTTDRPLRVGYLGTLIPSKGLDVLVDAVRRLPPGTATLDVHGNAVPYHDDVGFLTRVFQRLEPADMVTYHGPYDGARLPDVLASLDVVVAPALWQEAFGLTVREALAAGRPVVVSRIGGLQDAIEDGVEGRVVTPGDVEGLADALRELAGDRALRARMSTAARERVRGFAPMAAELCAVYAAIGATDPGPSQALA